MSEEKRQPKTKEELQAIKEEVETLSKKLAELTEEELAQVSGGMRLLVGGAEDAKDLYRVVSLGEVPVVG